MLPCHGFLDPCIKLIFTQVFFIVVVMDEQNFLVPTCGRLVSFASTLVALTIEWLFISCVFATWGRFSLRKFGLKGSLGVFDELPLGVGGLVVGACLYVKYVFGLLYLMS